MASPSAASISAFLSRNGFNPVGSGSNREGIKVKGNTTFDRVAVVVDLDSPRAARGLADSVEAALIEGGFETERQDTIIYVTGRST